MAQNTIILIMGTPKMVPLNFEKPPYHAPPPPPPISSNPVAAFRRRLRSFLRCPCVRNLVFEVCIGYLNVKPYILNTTPETRTPHPQHCNLNLNSNYPGPTTLNPIPKILSRVLLGLVNPHTILTSCSNLGAVPLGMMLSKSVINPQP